MRSYFLILGCLLACLWAKSRAIADDSLAQTATVQAAIAQAAYDPVTQVGCTNCNSGLLGGILAPPTLPPNLPPGGIASLPPHAWPDGTLPPWAPPIDPPCADCGCAGSSCVPGRKEAPRCVPKGHLHAIACGLYECIANPDPCYEGRWTPMADAAFYTEAVRPVIQQRLRWNSAQNVLFPDRNTYLWARADGSGLGPSPKSPFLGERSLRYDDLVLITEGGTATVSLIVTTTYRSLQAEELGRAAGFADMSIGTKTLLFDCELLQVSMLMTTHLPTGRSIKGLGTGHVSLEPTLLMGIKLTPMTYLQTQLSQWIPIAGDPDYAGGVLRYNFSLNQELYRVLPDVPIFGTLEYNGMSFQDGLYTDPLSGPQKSSGVAYAMLGLGLRMFVAERMDFGVSSAFSLTKDHFDGQNYRIEFRMRY